MNWIAILTVFGLKLALKGVDDVNSESFSSYRLYITITCGLDGVGSFEIGLVVRGTRSKLKAVVDSSVCTSGDVAISS